MKVFALVFFLIPSLLITSSAFAIDVMPVAAAEARSDFDEEGLTDEDTQVDLEAEVLPTTNKFGYIWEQFRGAAITVFTFSATKKAVQYRLRLHNLDRKLAACSEIGDEECMEKIEERMQKLSDHTEKYIAKREFLKDQHLIRFQNWRAKRESRIELLEQKTAQNENSNDELLEKRLNKRPQAIIKRKAWNKEMRPNIKKDRKPLPEEIIENREQLIEMRSENVKNKLDQAREKVQIRQDSLDALNGG